MECNVYRILFVVRTKILPLLVYYKIAVTFAKEYFYVVHNLHDSLLRGVDKYIKMIQKRMIDK